MKTLLINLKMHSLHRTGGCSELKFYFLLDRSDSWELGPKLVFRGSDPPLVFLTCVFSLALWILVVCSSCLCLVNRVDLCNKSFYSEGINCAALESWWDCTLTFNFGEVCLRVGKFFFEENIYYICWYQKECGSWWCKRGLSVVKVVCANCFLVTDLETFRSFWNISDPLFSLFGGFWENDTT